MFCETCVKAKITWQPFPDQSNSHATKYGECIHTDVWGPAKVQSLGKKWYHVTFMDDYSCEMTVIFLWKRSGVFGALIEHITCLVTQHDAKVKFIRSDHGGEFSSDKLQRYFSKHGIHHEYTVHNSPKQNGVAEQVN
jgi:hypothetical protein